MNLERRLGLKDDETLLAVARRAAVTLFLPGLATAVFALAPFVFLVPLLRLATIGYVLIGLSLLVALSIASRVWWDWQGSFLAVTERRLILVHQHGVFDRHVAEMPYSRIQRVSYRVHGLFPTLFRYGTLLIESAGNEDPLTMENIPGPHRLQDLINELQSGTHGGFGDVLQSVSKLDARQLGLLKSEIDRTIRLLPPEDRA